MKQIKRVITDFSYWLSLTMMVEERFKKRATPLMVTIGAPPKTWRQLAYMHDVIIPTLIQPLYDLGEIKAPTERQVKYWVKVQANYGEWIDWNNGKIFDPDSFKDADKEAMSFVIQTALDKAAELDIYIPEPK